MPLPSREPVIPSAIKSYSICASIGSLLAGVLVHAFSYSAIIWMSAVAFAIGLLANVFGLWPVERKKRAEEAKEKCD